jgi:hypothetical protein
MLGGEGVPTNEGSGGATQPEPPASSLTLLAHWARRLRRRLPDLTGLELIGHRAAGSASGGRNRPIGASGSFAEAVALHHFRTARRAGEPNLLIAILDVDGPDAHRRDAAVTLWKQHTRVGGHRLSLHIPSLQLWSTAR